MHVNFCGFHYLTQLWQATDLNWFKFIFENKIFDDIIDIAIMHGRYAAFF